MSRISCSQGVSQAIYLHHSVIKQFSTTIKLRVVFNAFSPTTNAMSLNDHLCVGQNCKRMLPLFLSAGDYITMYI